MFYTLPITYPLKKFPILFRPHHHYKVQNFSTVSPLIFFAQLRAKNHLSTPSTPFIITITE
jgi:hypothetical protein